MEYVVAGLLALIGALLVVAIRRLAGLDQLGTVVDRLERLEVALEEMRPIPTGAFEPENDEDDEEDADEAAVRTPPVEVSVDVSGDLRGAVAEAIAGVERDVRKLVRILGRTRAERLERSIVDHLASLGYREIRVTGGLPQTGAKTRSSRVVVDAELDGVRSRGHVLLREGRIAETNLRPLNRLFP